MEFRKIQLTKQNTLTVVYRNGDSDTITMAGANIVHKDLKAAMRALIPHLALLTDQREAMGCSLDELVRQDGTDEKSVYHRLSVSEVTLGENEVEVSVSGTRILSRGDIVKVDGPKLNLEDDDKYEYLGELQLAIDNLKYEVKLYIEERKWGLKEGTLNFGEAGDPFDGVQPGDVPKVTVEVNDGQPKKKGRKKKEPQPEAA